ncbi:ABC transporter ATP-binding protein [Clostridium sp. HBUAS56010]|uniref:ABC transporter ATP-binding protein n=1 Tax=Clostridium sp. HBUAS56010 TaxID=2571127 RepID=UPI0011788664|nr:ABC transporter ATP-binding protein [Clostridium sp. HBUAS56010]
MNSELVAIWQITLCLMGVNLIMLLVNAVFIKPIRNATGVLSRINSKMTEKLSNLLQGMEQARMYSAGSNTVKEFTIENETYAKQSRYKNFYIACLDSCNHGFDLLCALAFLLLGIYFVQNNHTSLGSLAAIYALYGKFSYQFLQMGRYIPELIGCLINAQNVFDFIEEAEESDSWYKNLLEEGENLEMQEGNILDINRISFQYREEKVILRNYSLSVREGECVAITGPSGCGKTTLSKLLLGLYPLAAGDIRIKGVSYHELINAEIRKQIAYVPQEPYLFNQSIGDNIRIGRPDASHEEVIRAAKIAHAHTFIESLENGYDTFVGERGNQLSGGQRQRIAIARAILKDAPVILFDEATSALDNESERLFNDALKSMKKHKTA